MTASLIDGKAIAAEIRTEVKQDVAGLVSDGISPGLAVVLVGDDPASKAYVGGKIRACEEVGILSIQKRFSSDVSEAELLAVVDSLNSDDAILGFLVQLPLPDHIDENLVIERIHPSKDVDGFHPENVGRMMVGIDGFLPCTPAGIPEMILRSGLTLAGKHAVIVGRSNIVGKPLMNILVQKSDRGNCTVSCCHSGTADLGAITRQADILVSAIGVPGFVTADMVKPGAIVIDVGINRVDDPQAKRGYRLVGDVDFEPVAEIAHAITPVPGGVGPMTIAMLMKNTVRAARLTV
jgi:methylenetetrahydrofolate dehydrogenase (NADP+)/methenyltetrahydrofolate cyclohydrolase